MLAYKHPAQGDCGAAEGDLSAAASAIERRSIWSHAWPGPLDFTHGFKSSKHDEMLDSLLISPAGLAYTSNFSTHAQTHTGADKLYHDLLGVGLNFTLRLIYFDLWRLLFFGIFGLVW